MLVGIKIKRLLLACWLLLGFASPALAEETIIVQLKWLHQFQFAGYYAALEQGYFAEEGLQVELRERDMSRNNIHQVIEGEAHYGVADSVLLLYHQRGEEVVLVAPIFQHSPNVMMTMRNRGIYSPRDLIGRRLAFYDNDSDGVALLAMLASHGVLEAGLQRHGWADRLDRLVAGEVDAVSVYATNEPYMMRELGHDISILDPKHYGIDFYGDIFFTSRQEADKHPERVEAMRRAVIRGWHYALDNKEALVDLIYTRYNTQGKSRDALMNEALGLEALIARHTLELGTLSPGRLEYMLDILERYDLVQESSRGAMGLAFESRAPRGLALNETERQFLARLPVLRVGMDPDWPPFEYQDGAQQWQGISTDYLALIGEKLGIEFELVSGLDWTEVLEQARRGEIDLLPAVSVTPPRREFLSFSQPYVRSPMVVVTRQGEDYLGDIRHLSDRSVGVVRGYASEDWMMHSYPELNIHPVNTTLAGLQQVSNGELYALVDNLAAVSHMIRTEGLANLQISGQTPYSFDLSMAVGHHLADLAPLLTRAMNAIPESTHAEIYHRWVRLEMGQAFPWRQVLLPMLALALLLLILGAYTLYLIRLNRRVQRINGQLQRTEQELKASNQALEVISRTDKLTGCHNRLALDEALQHQVALAQRYGRPLSVVLFDLDHFKQVNDTLGHQKGDEVLSTFVKLVLSRVRASDFFGRWGGEEFLLICPETTALEAHQVADKMRASLSQRDLGIPWQPTVSAGVLQYQPGMTVDELLSAVDKRLYLAKTSGRNRIVSDDQKVTPA